MEKKEEAREEKGIWAMTEESAHGLKEQLSKGPKLDFEREEEERKKERNNNERKRAAAKSEDAKRKDVCLPVPWMGGLGWEGAG